MSDEIDLETIITEDYNVDITDIILDYENNKNNYIIPDEPFNIDLILND